MEGVPATIEFYDEKRKQGALILDPEYRLDPEIQVEGGRVLISPYSFETGLHFEKGQRVWCSVGRVRSGNFYAEDVRSYSR